MATEPITIISLSELSMSFLRENLNSTACVVFPRRHPATRLLNTTHPPLTTHPRKITTRRSSLEFADEIGGSVGAALRMGKADLNSCKLSQVCVGAGINLDHDLHLHAHGLGEKYTSSDGSVFITTPAAWRAALQARLGTPRHCKDVAHALNRSGILFTGDALSILDTRSKHGVEGFTGDAWLFELECVRAYRGCRAHFLAPTFFTRTHTHTTRLQRPCQRGWEEGASREPLADGRARRRGRARRPLNARKTKSTAFYLFSEAPRPLKCGSSLPIAPPPHPPLQTRGTAARIQ
jgi:hypothetical protein